MEFPPGNEVSKKNIFFLFGNELPKCLILFYCVHMSMSSRASLAKLPVQFAKFVSLPFPGYTVYICILESAAIRVM